MASAHALTAMHRRPGHSSILIQVRWALSAVMHIIIARPEPSALCADCMQNTAECERDSDCCDGLECQDDRCGFGAQRSCPPASCACIAITLQCNRPAQLAKFRTSVDGVNCAAHAFAVCMALSTNLPQLALHPIKATSAHCTHFLCRGCLWRHSSLPGL